LSDKLEFYRIKKGDPSNLRPQDVLCFQEIKVEDKNFSSEDFKKLGYVYQDIFGRLFQKSTLSF
jgi:exonuclease III